MNTSIHSGRDNTLRTVLTATSLVVALAALSTRANAHSFVDPANKITVSAPTEQIMGTDFESGAPRKDIVVVARVKTDPAVLTTNSGVALFKDSVVEAAREACGADVPHSEVDTTCLRNALKEAKPQVAAIIAKARSGSNS
jgi:UrcA family protein